MKPFLCGGRLIQALGLDRTGVPRGSFSIWDDGAKEPHQNDDEFVRECFFAKVAPQLVPE